MKAIVGNNFIRLENFKYFVGKASSVGFGAYGTKEATAPGGSASRLDVFDHIPTPKLEEMQLTVTGLDISFDGTSGTGLFTGISVPGKGSGRINVGVASFTSGTVQLVKISPKDDHELIKQINAAGKAKDKLIEFGGKARVAVDLLVVVSGAVYTEFLSGLSGKGDIAFKGGMVSPSVLIGTDVTSSIEVSPNTVVGYSLAEPKWDAHQDKNKSAVTELRFDEPGL